MCCTLCAFDQPHVTDTTARNKKKLTHIHLRVQLAEIQSRLLDVGSAVATPSDPTNSAGAKVKRTRFDPAHSTALEVWQLGTLGAIMRAWGLRQLFTRCTHRTP